RDDARARFAELAIEALACERVIGRDGPCERAGGELAVFAEALARDDATYAEEAEVVDEQLEARVADALADTEAGAVHAVHAGLRGPERGREREAAIVVAVPVELDVRGAHRGELAAREADQRLNAVRRDVARRIAEAEAAPAFVDRGLEERAERVGVR